MLRVVFALLGNKSSVVAAYKEQWNRQWSDGPYLIGRVVL